jgi:hypothetical protein
VPRKPGKGQQEAPTRTPSLHHFATRLRTTPRQSVLRPCQPIGPCGSLSRRRTRGRRCRQRPSITADSGWAHETRAPARAAPEARNGRRRPRTQAGPTKQEPPARAAPEARNGRRRPRTQAGPTKQGPPARAAPEVEASPIRPATCRRRRTRSRRNTRSPGPAARPPPARDRAAMGATRSAAALSRGCGPDRSYPDASGSASPTQQAPYRSAPRPASRWDSASLSATAWPVG